MVGRVSFLIFMPDVNFSEISNPDFPKPTSATPPAPQNTPMNPLKTPSFIFLRFKALLKPQTRKYTRKPQKPLKSPENSLKINFTNHPPHTHTHQPKIFNHFYPKKPLRTPPQNFPDPNFQVRFTEAPPSGKIHQPPQNPQKPLPEFFPTQKSKSENPRHTIGKNRRNPGRHGGGSVEGGLKWGGGGKSTERATE